jgi:hypothetical protein
MSLQAFPAPFIYDLFKGMGNYSLSYVYKGNLDPQLTERILDLAETNMNITGESSKTQKRVFFIMVESLQNITRHQDNKKEAEEATQSFFVMQNTGKEYQISSGNVIESSKVEEVKGKLEKVNSLGQDELKEYFKEVLSTTGISEKGGAGLGLIEMARRSGNKLAFDFRTVNEAMSYFYFQVLISQEQRSFDNDALIGSVKDLHAMTLEKNINLIYHGLFTHDNLKSLLSMTEGSVVSKDDLSFKRKAVNVMIELLQNICNHGGRPDASREGNPGLLLVTYANGECILSAGNFIENKNVEKLRSKLEGVNRAGEKELDDMYAEIIMREDEVGAKGAGLGFVDMKLKTGHNLDFEMLPLDERFSFFTLQVKVSK